MYVRISFHTVYYVIISMFLSWIILLYTQNQIQVHTYIHIMYSRTYFSCVSYSGVCVYLTQVYTVGAK